MTERFRDFPRSFQLSVVISVIAFAATAAFAVPSGHLDITAILTLLFAATCLIEPVPSPFGGFIDPNIGLIIIAALLWPPQDVLLGVGIGSLLGLILFRKHEVWRALINATGWGLPAAAASIIAHSAISSTGQGLARLVAGGVLAVATYRVTNTGIITMFRSLGYRRPFLAHWLQNVEDAWSSQLLSAPLAIVLAAIAERTQSQELRLALTAAYVIALPIARSEYGYYFRAQQMLDEIVEAVVRALEGVYPPAREHGDRVSAIAVETGRRLNLSEKSLTALRLAGRLHDVGLLAGKEEAVVEVSPAAVGGRILRRFPDPLVAQYIAALRKRWDGKGAPNGVSGESIPLGARILSACEIYDCALSGLAPFDSPLSVESTRSYLISLCGTTLDPRVVMALLKVANESQSKHSKQ